MWVSRTPRLHADHSPDNVILTAKLKREIEEISRSYNKCDLREWCLKYSKIYCYVMKNSTEGGSQLVLGNNSLVVIDKTIGLKLEIKGWAVRNR